LNLMSTQAGTSPGRRIRAMQVVVSEVVVETPDTVTLVYEGPDEYEYRAGQFLTIDPHQFPSLRRWIQLLEQLKKKKEPPRAYSMASAPHEPLAITIKEETWTPGEQKYPTVLSPFLVHEVKAGMPMTVSGFTGPYHLPDDIESTDGSHRPPVRRLGQRAELLDPEGRAAGSPAPAAHFPLLEQDVGGHHLPRRARTAWRPSTRTVCASCTR
jgi:hypothetical protein